MTPAYPTSGLSPAVPPALARPSAPWALAGGPGVLSERMRVLLVEDDEGDAYLAGELLDEADAPVALAVVPTLADALPLLPDVDCVLLDLNLPDNQGNLPDQRRLDGLRLLLREGGPGLAVCVLTGVSDEHLGIEAVTVGAQDYLVKGFVDGKLLTRSIRFAVERRRSEQAGVRLVEAELRQRESARLERGLLPQPLISTGDVTLHKFYRPGRRRALLGGDFYDAVQTGPARLNLLVGDVCGHGAEEAALGVTLRVAWRALTLGGTSDESLLHALEQVLVSERRADEVFATLAMATVDLAAGSARVHKCGHPPPLLIEGDRVTPIDRAQSIALGMLPVTEWPADTVALPAGEWALLVYTDGVIEGRRAGGRLGVAGLCDLVTRYRETGQPIAAMPDWLVSQAEEHNGGPLPDDVAMLLLTKDSTTPATGATR
ncbi:MAG TPA: SpoIIE family protein phosphatase [Rugosimonospora sp.]|nr:SpoIIE family protein phosphatase [Rugosimonospora sp.]